MALTPEELLLLEIDYNANGRWCKVLQTIGNPDTFCRRERGHAGEIHATRCGPDLLSWTHSQRLEVLSTDEPRAN